MCLTDFLNYAWKKFMRRNDGCPASLMEKTAEVITHDDWQFPRRIGVHHWTSTWHKMEDYDGWRQFNESVRTAFLLSGNITLNQGLTDWLGVDRSRDCMEGSFEATFRNAGLVMYRIVSFDRKTKEHEAKRYLYALRVNESLVPPIPMALRWPNSFRTEVRTQVK
jgi:hypothetical protein